MNPGESRRVIVPGGSTLTKSVSIRHRESGKDGGDVTVWRKSGSCPTLSGPPVELRESHRMVLSPGDYEYDYYHLNPGSTVDATLAPSRGGASLLLIKGKGGFDRWVANPDDVENSGGFITKAFSSSRFRPARVSFKATAADTYYVAYDNAMGRTTEVAADVSVTLTTYDAAKMRPLPPSSCSPERSSCSVGFDLPKSAGCIVVRAEIPHSFVESDGGVRNEQGATATVEIVTHRRWSVIMLLCVIALLLSHLFCGGERSSAEEEDVDGGDGDGVHPYQEVDHQGGESEVEEEMPPPTVPGRDRDDAARPMPSAPHEVGSDNDEEDVLLDGTVIGHGEGEEYDATIPVAVPVPHPS